MGGRESGGGAVLLPLSQVEHLSASYRLDIFDCGDDILNAWLRLQAPASEVAGHARTYVVHRDGIVVGYYVIAAGSVGRAAAPGRLRRNAPEPIPVLLLARLAVDLTERARGSRLGSLLLRDAIERCVSAADVIGAKAIMVHALDERARGFYMHHDFAPSPLDPLMLFITIADCRGLLGLPPA